MWTKTRLGLLAACAGCLVTLGCDDSDPPKNPFDPPPDKIKQPPPIKEVPKPEGPPAFEIDSIGPKVGFSRAVLETPEGKSDLQKELKENEKYIDGKSIKLRIDRKAKMSWVVTYLEQLGKLGAEGVTIATETRKEYPGELTFTPLAQVDSPKPCAMVAMVLEDRATAVWKLSGGVASKRAKGMAGPDLTMTGETMQRIGKQCKDSSMLFVSAADEIEWGLAYDLAASSQKLEKLEIDTVVLLQETPVPGHEVEL